MRYLRNSESHRKMQRKTGRAKMINIFRMGLTFLRKSKMLSFSAFLSIFLACFLGISMLQLAISAEIAYKNNILEEYGDFDIGITKNNNISFSESEIEQIENIQNVQKISCGYYVADLDGIYTVGVKDDSINKSRYKYTCDIAANDIIINKYLAEKKGNNLGDIFIHGNREYIVKEVLEGDSFSKSKIELAIVDMTRLLESLGVEKNPNYIMLKCQEKADLDSITEQLVLISQGDFQVSCVSQNEDFKKMLQIFEGLLLVLFVIVVVICGMFILSIFQEFIRKYQCDMAIVRTIGGRYYQVNCIFMSMSVVLSFAGCVLGVMVCAVVDGYLLNKMNEILNLFDGDIVLEWESMLLMAGVIFVIYNVVSALFFVLKQRVLPLQVFQRNLDGLKRKKRANRFLFARKIFGTDGYLAIKFLMPKFWQNFTIVVIIGLITALSYTGHASIKLLNENSFQYYRNVLNGSEAGAEYYSTNELTVDEIRNMWRDIRETTEQCSYLMGGYYNSGYSLHSDINTFYVTDLVSFMEQFPGEQIKHYETVPKEQRVIMTRKTAHYSGYSLGDKIFLDSQWLGGKHEYTIVEIVDWNHDVTEDAGIILEQSVLSGKDKNAYCPYEAYFYVKEYTEQTREVFEKYEVAKEGFKWLSMEEIMKEGNDVSNQRVTMISVILVVLIIIAGIGWLNSAKGMLLARENEYHVLRMLGTDIKSVRRISWIQVWSYMSAGIILGMAVGLVVVYFLWRSNVNPNVSISIYWENVFGIVVYMFMLSMGLRTTIKQLSM